MKPVLNIFLKPVKEALTDRVNERQQDQVCAPAFQNVHLSVSRSGFVAGRYNPCLKDYMKNGSLTGDRPALWNQVPRVLAFDGIEPSKRMQDRFVLIAGNGEDGSVLWVVRVLLLFRINSETDSNTKEYALQTYMECIPLLDEIDTELAVYV